MLPDIKPIDTQSWKKLEAHFQVINKKHLKQLFEEDPLRAEKFSFAWEELFVDFSKTHVTEETLTYSKSWQWNVDYLKPSNKCLVEKK